MSTKNLNVRLRHAIRTESEWQSSDPVLLEGEIGFASDKGLFKVGNGTSKWSELSYNLANSLYGLTTSIAELNYIDGVKSNVQTQLDSKAPLEHTHDEYVNQNAFSNIKVGSTTVSADTKTDTLTLEGSNVTITPDATNDKITIAVANGSTSAKGIVQLTDSTSSTSTTTAATPKSVKSAYDLANTAKTNAEKAQDTADGKADAEHGHEIADVNGLQSALDGKAPTSHGTHVSYSSTAPVMDGTANAGSASTVARSDHKHPTDTSRAAKTDFDAHVADTTKHVTATERTNWNDANSKKHSHSNKTILDNTTASYTTAEKTKLESTNIAYATCSTAAATAEKVITISGNTNWKLVAGSRITIKFSYTNTASNPTFNINSTGAKSVWYNTALITTSNLSYAGYANRPMDFVYDGTQYIFIGWSVDNNTTYSNASLGQGYGTCSTAEATTAKVVTLSSYSLTTGGIVAVKFTYAVPANATMNINSKGAKSIYYKGSAIVVGIIQAGDTGIFIYDGSQYHLLSVDRDNDTTYGAAGSSLGFVKTGGDVTISNGVITVNDDSHNHTISNIDNLQTELDRKLALRPQNWNYNNLGSYYCGSSTPSYIRIAFASNMATVWTMFYAEISIRQTYSSNLAGKLYISGYHNGSSPYTWSLKCVTNTTLSSIKVYAKSQYIYIAGVTSYGAISVDKVLTGDTINSTDLSSITIDTVTALPDGYATAIMVTTLTTENVAGGASTIINDNLTASRVLISNSSGKVVISDITTTELGYLDGVTSNLQTQLNGKQATITGAATTITGSNLTASRALISNSSGKIAVSSVTSTELGYLGGVTSAIQTQLDSKLSLTGGILTGNVEISKSDTTYISSKVTNSNGSVGIYTATNRGLYDFTSERWMIYTSSGANGTVTVTGNCTGSSASCTGNSATATKLKTPRTIQTNLGSTSSASFDGSANITPGVTGTLPIANGGTGATSATGILTNLGITATASEINKLDGLTATTTELNYVDGVTSSIQAQLDAKAKGASKSATTPATAGWYRIATTSANINNNTGIFQIVGYVSGKHTTAIVTAGTSYGVSDSSNVSVLQCSQYSGNALTKVRIVYHTTYSGNYAYLEVYNPSDKAIAVYIHLIGGYGWSLVSPDTAGSVPSGYLSKEATLSNGTIYSPYFSGDGSSLTKLNASNISSGTLTLARGGTGATTAKAAEYNILAGMETSTSAMTDTTRITFTYVSPSTTAGRLYYREATMLWDYIKGKITGGISTVITSNLTASRALISDSNGKIAVSAVTSTELGYLSGVTSSIQTQLNTKYNSTTSRTANTVLAAPNGSAGAATFRKLVAADLPTSGATAGSYGASSATTLAYSGSFNVPYVTVDAYGRVTGIKNISITLPASDNTDINVKQTVSTTSNYRALLMGTSHSATVSDLSTEETGQVYKSTNIYACPSTGSIYASKFVGSLSGTATNATSATTATKLTMTAGSDNLARRVWFSHSSEDGRMAYDDDFKYNPNTNTLVVANIEGNISTATKLKTARTINGTSFDGSSNITTANWGTARTITIGSTGKSVNGSTAVSWTHNEMSVPKVVAGYSFGGEQTEITTADFITLLTDAGAFEQRYWITRGSWSYASNRYITDTECGIIHLAGCTVEVISADSTHYTIKVHAPTTSSKGVANADWIYVNNGSGYYPGWRRLYSNKYKPSADKWTTARTITLTGSVTGSVSIDGSGNVSLATTTNHTHDDRYFTESEIDSKLASYSLTTHTHNYAGSSSAGGSANSADKWSTARNLNGMSVDGSADRVNYGTCSTAAATVAKVVACTGFTLVTGAEITVKFTVTNTASSPTLNVNSTGAKAIYYRGSAITAGYLAANRTYTFRYNGTQYELVGDINTDTNTDTNVTQTISSTTNANYRILLSGTADDTTRTEGVRKDADFYYNPSTNILTVGTVNGTILSAQEALSGNLGTQTPFSTNTNLYYVNKKLTWNTSSYHQHVILLLPVLTSSNWSGINYIDGKFMCWKTGANIYDTVIISANCAYNNLKYHLSYYGDHASTGWKLCVCTYNGVSYYALKCPYHANPYTNVEFVGHMKSVLTGGTSTVSLPLDVAYYNENTSTVLNSEVNNSITETLTTTYVTSVTRTSLHSPGGFSGNSSTATKLATARTISLTGSVTGSGTFDGSGNLSISTTTNHNHDSSYVNVGGDTMTGTLVLSKATDLSGTANNSPALIVGGTATTAHIEMDCNEIQAKSDGTTTTGLYLNNDGGLVTIGSGGLTVDGTITGTLSGNASSSTYATNARITVTNPTSGTWYYPTWTSGITANTNYPLRGNNGFVYYTLEGTTSANGRALLQLGNSTASGTAANKYGEIRMYGTGAYYTQLAVGTQTANRTITFPDASGTVSLTDTKNTAGSTDTSSKIFLIGATSQAANPQTYSHDTCYVGTDGHLYSDSKQVVNLSGSQALTNKTYNGYTLAAACAKAVTDSSSASAISTGTSLVTERDVYYGLPTINGAHTYTSSTNIYAPTSVGTSGYVLKSGGSGAPSWVAQSDLSVGSATKATQVYSTTVTPTSSTTYVIPFHSSATSENKSLNNTDGLGLALLQGTASAEGYATLEVGNAIAKGIIGNKTGGIRIYASTGYYSQIVPGSPTANRTITLPNASGTVSLTGHTHDYLPLSGGELTTSSFYGLAIKRSVSNNGAAISYQNADGAIGGAGFLSGGTFVVSSGSNTDGGIFKASSTEAIFPNAISIKRKSGTTVGSCSVVLGNEATASNYYSFAGGYTTTSTNYASTVIGKFNKAMTSGAAYNTTVGDVFVIGNGTLATSLSNAFRVTYTGASYGLSAFNSSGADYAEFVYPWYDNNENNEDRIGYFVTFKDGKLYKASSNDLILGVTSGNPSVIGNADEDYYWKYERDEFNRIIFEDVEEEIEIVDNTGNITFEKTGNIIKNGRMKLNPDYDTTLQDSYIERKDRKEWDYVGMVGMLPVRDDGTCIAGQYCKCNDMGIATLATPEESITNRFTYIVLERISDNVVMIIK